MILILILLILFFTILILFSSPKLSPIPYFPTSKKDLPLIIKALNLKNNKTIIDLGAGTGSVIFAAAAKAYQKKLNTQFLAIDINPILILIMQLRRLFQPNKKNIRIINDNMFTMKFNSLTREPVNLITFYLYISPWFLEKIIENLIPPMAGKNFNIVSYMYPVPNLKPQKIFAGKNKIFLYKI